MYSTKPLRQVREHGLGCLGICDSLDNRRERRIESAWKAGNPSNPGAVVWEYAFPVELVLIVIYFEGFLLGPVEVTEALQRKPQSNIPLQSPF